jgi:kinesin family protein 4/21/27
VYGEDVYDLLDANRNSLPLREDSEKGIVVVGLTSRPISGTTEALQVLHEGTMNRTTAATLMNLTSSRSHAVFTIHLSQVTRSANGGKIDVTTTSCFTFVDLAGSERMKKTGAEGERAREGIKINEGLLALGNVINALADEERAVKEKKIHIPYRQSKLTRLLQDALGGNSQTLFLACVSPSDTNASETLSTLNYANRARNIRNAPTKNVDATVVELQRLYAVNRILQFELVKSRFQNPLSNDAQEVSSIGTIDDSLLKREDVEEYIQMIYQAASEMMSPGKSNPPSFSGRVPLSETTMNHPHVACEQKDTAALATSGDTKAPSRNSEKFDYSVLDDINPDEEMAILDYLLEIQQQDQDYEKAKKQDDEKLKEMNGELEKEEAMLLQLRESLKVYHGLKRKYEELMTEVQQLETEKADLARQLERATADPSKGCSQAIKKKLERVEMNLSRARRETLSHREKYRYAEEQARKCKVLERKVDDLKQAKLSLIKNQKEAAARYKETTEAKTKELMIMKRREKATDRKMSKMENELRIHKTTLAKRKKYCIEISEKLKQTEAHLVKLLSMRQRDLAAKNRALSSSRNSTARGSYQKDFPSYLAGKSCSTLSDDDMKATKYVFDRMVMDKVKQTRLKQRYEELVSEYSETMRKVVSEVRKLEEIRKLPSQSEEASVKEQEETIADLELRLELLDSEIHDTSTQMPKDCHSSERDIDDAVNKLLSGMSGSVVKSLLMETFSKFIDVEVSTRVSLKKMCNSPANPLIVIFLILL